MAMLLFCGYIAIIAPARSFRGHGGIETPMFLVLLTPKEHNRSFPNIVLDTHRHGFKGSRRFALFGSFDIKRTIYLF